MGSTGPTWNEDAAQSRTTDTGPVSPPPSRVFIGRKVVEVRIGGFGVFGQVVKISMAGCSIPIHCNSDGSPLTTRGKCHLCAELCFVDLK